MIGMDICGMSLLTTEPVLHKIDNITLSGAVFNAIRVDSEITKDFDIECAKKYKPRRNDVFMVKSGSTTGKVAFVDTDADFNVWSPLAAMRTDNEITARYIYHFLQTSSAQNMVFTRMSHGSQPNLSMRTLEQFDIKIPSFDEQRRIVAILDRFDALCNDLTSGLPAEIAARQKQYEYYRDKLLTFKPLA